MGLVRRIRPIARKGLGHLNARWRFRRAHHVGARVRLRGRARVRTEGTLVIGDRVRFVGHVVPVEIGVDRGATLTIGDRTFVNYGVSIGATSSVRVGADCDLGPYVNIVDNDFHRLEPDRRRERPEPSPVEIGDNVWLATRVMVLPGVTIGDGSIVAAGSIVTRDIPPCSLAMGAPARVVRSLADPGLSDVDAELSRVNDRVLE